MAAAEQVEGKGKTGESFSCRVWLKVGPRLRDFYGKLRGPTYSPGGVVCITTEIKRLNSEPTSFSTNGCSTQKIRQVGRDREVPQEALFVPGQK